MKTITHNLFSAGLSFYLLSHTGIQLFIGFLLAVWLSLAVNGLIDILGHLKKGDVPARSLITHSIFTAPLWGGFVGLASILVPVTILNLDVSSNLAFLTLGVGVIIAYSHLFLDALTEAGVYLGRRRIAIAHLSYNNPALNLVFAIIGVFLLIIPFSQL